MYLALENTDVIKLDDFRQTITFNRGAVEERATFSFSDALYTRENINILKKYLKKGDGAIYTFSLRDTEDGPNTREFKCHGFINIEWVAPENSNSGNPYFMASAQELIF